MASAPNGIVSFFAPINVRMESADRFEFNYIPEYEYLAAPFEIVPGVVIPPGAYRFTRFRVEAQSSPHRPIEAGFTTRFGTFYNGTRTQWEQCIRWTSPKGKLRLGYSREQFRSSEGGKFRSAALATPIRLCVESESRAHERSSIRFGIAKLRKQHQTALDG